MQEFNFKDFLSYMKRNGHDVSLREKIREKNGYRTDVFIGNGQIGSIYQVEVSRIGGLRFEGRLPGNIHPPARRGEDIILSYDYGNKGGSRTDKWTSIPFP